MKEADEHVHLKDDRREAAMAAVQHLAADPRIAVLVLSRSDPYTHMTVRGLASLEERGAIEHANELARKYGRRGTYVREAGRLRVIIRVLPLSVT